MDFPAPLKILGFVVDTLDRMLRITLMDDSVIEIPREEAIELLPYGQVFATKLLKSPIEAVLTYRGKIVPVLGPLPEPEEWDNSVDERPWILLLKGCAQVVRGLPDFQDVSEVRRLPEHEEGQSELLGELEDLLKSA